MRATPLRRSPVRGGASQSCKEKAKMRAAPHKTSLSPATGLLQLPQLLMNVVVFGMSMNLHASRHGGVAQRGVA